MSTHNICFEQNYKKYQIFLSENFQFLVVKFSIYFVFVMRGRGGGCVRFFFLFCFFQ